MNADYTYFHATVGGVMVGFASLLALLATGKIPGISGLFSRVLQRPGADTGWRIIFLLGLVGGAAIAFAAVDASTVYRPISSVGAVIGAGLLVGFGTRLSGGCTSGHGVCGVGMGSKSAVVATLVFMIAGIATVFVLRHTGLFVVR